MKVLELLDYLQQTIEMSPKNLVGKVSVNKKEVIKTLNEMRRLIPDELEEAKNIIKRKESILGEAKREEEAIIANSRKRAQDEYDNCDILLEARREAQEILDNAKSEAKKVKSEAMKQAKELKFGVMNYADNTLSNLQKDIDIIGEESLKSMQDEMEEMLIKMYKQISTTTSKVRENIKDLGEI
ncbi:MAG: HrpE/YscL family type III secretion apparatus protein [Clostridium sp.]|uniref:HrpE/YscL family type III secretion apparatus protein n=1 Tax=Clostridium sp. TaxID=1506 RepID=UPI00302D8AEF